MGLGLADTVPAGWEGFCTEVQLVIEQFIQQYGNN